MVAAHDIGWGRYREYEGPYYKGACKYELPAERTVEDELLYVITATEGGAYDAYNGYDRCICTCGLVQWCDAAPLFLFTKLLGYIGNRDLSLLKPLLDHADAKGYDFGPSTHNGWWFTDRKTGTIVNNKYEQRKLCLGGSTGAIGEWTTEQRSDARSWAAACANIWANPEAQRLQRQYTAPRLMGFATKSAKPILELAEENGGVYGKVLRAAYISFAANNPARASEALSHVVSKSGVNWDGAWLKDVLKALVFDSGIAIYPHRYNTIRPVIEALYNYDLPDFADELQTWKTENGFYDYVTVETLQLVLMELGYHIGPSGADNVFGKKTQSALALFEKEHDVPISHNDGYPDRYTIPALQEALKKRGCTPLWEVP